jgi:predicted anti-sigma-YlaC factor YlaD
LLSCRDVTERATDLMERRLPLREWLAMRVHLGMCRACRNYMDQLRKTVGLLADPRLKAELRDEDVARVSAGARGRDEKTQD